MSHCSVNSHNHGDSASTEEHRHEAQHIGPVPSAVIVITDSRNERTARSGQTASRLIKDGGHNVIHQALIRNEAIEIRAALETAIELGSKFIFCTGGTGLGDRDITVDTVTPMLDKVLDGYGEWFRRASWEQIGPASILSRAIAGKLKQALVVCSPGSTAAVELALNGLLIPELPHLVREVSR